MNARAFLESLFDTAVAAAHPATCLPPHLPAPPANGRLILLAAGKAAGSMIEIAERHGAKLPPVEVQPPGVRSLVEVAVENAAEGCVRETYGAAVAVFQGERAGDRSVRLALRVIAGDEAEHAALGWAVDAWARSRLSRAGRARLDAAREEARGDLLARVQSKVPLELASALGVPPPEAAVRLATAVAGLL